MALRFGRGQVSTEVLILVGIALFLLIPVILYAYGRVNASGDDLSVQKAEFAAHRLASLADSVGYLGGAAAVVDEIEIPPYVKNVTVNGRDVVIKINSIAGEKDIVASTAFELEAVRLGKVSRAGTYFIEVSALDPGSAGGKQVRLRLS
jgi:uncharacterized protein (UPF0333 family)